jgi:hypothetical protein
MTRYSLCRRLGGPQGRYGRVRKTSLLPGFDPRIDQPVASHYTDYTIPAHIIRYDNIIICEKKKMIENFLVQFKVLWRYLTEVKDEAVGVRTGYEPAALSHEVNTATMFVC